MEAELNFEGYGAQPIVGIQFDADRHEFILNAGWSGELSCRVSYPFEALGPGAEEAFVELLFHPSHAESDVRPVKLSGKDGKTVGWLCTVGALVSTDHAYAESQHFRRAAYAAVHALLVAAKYGRSRSVANGAVANLSDFLDSGLSVLVLHRPTLGEGVEDTCSRILPSLHRCGFLPTVEESPSQPLGRPAIERFSEMGGNFVLRPMSTEVGFTPFTTQVFRQLLPTANTSLLRFFLYYQLIEAMMAVVFAHRQGETIEKMQSVRNDPVKVHPLIEKLKDDSSEKKRIRLLFNEYTASSAVTNELQEWCNEFLRRCELEEVVLPADALYQVRNVVFHGMRSIPERAFQAFDAIVAELACVVPELLMAFQLGSSPEAADAI
jgi:hypothetical protein